jgi:hypothetical protein
MAATGHPVRLRQAERAQHVGEALHAGPQELHDAVRDENPAESESQH